MFLPSRGASYDSLMYTHAGLLQDLENLQELAGLTSSARPAFPPQSELSLPAGMPPKSPAMAPGT